MDVVLGDECSGKGGSGDLHGGRRGGEKYGCKLDNCRDLVRGQLLYGTNGSQRGLLAYVRVGIAEVCLDFGHELPEDL